MFLLILSTKKYETIYSVLFLNQAHTRQINILLQFRLNLSSPKRCMIKFRNSHKTSRRLDEKYKFGRQKIERRSTRPLQGLGRVNVCFKSFIYIKRRSSPKIDPCGTPQFIILVSEKTSSIVTESSCLR